MLPNFLVIGAMKAGTTSLHRYLRQHPQVFMPEEKEPHYFVAEKSWSRGRAWYEAQFTGAGDALAVGEASPTYAMYPEFDGVADRIADLLPHVRLVYTVRDPIERIRSHYLHEVARGRERAPIARALASDRRYLDTSRYALQLDRYLLRFPPERMLVITAERLRHDRAATARQVFAFLGVDADWMPPTLDQEFHRTADGPLRRPLADAVLGMPAGRVLQRLAPQPLRRLARRRQDSRRALIPEALAVRLRRELRDDVHRLRKHLGEEFDGWGID